MTRSLLTAISFFFFYTCLHAQPLHPCAELIWYDEFDGTTLDASKWTPQIGDGCDINLCGWGNNESQYYTDREENVKVEGGNLVITALKESYGGKGYTSARIRSIEKGDFTFGRMEARIKLPQGAGSWPAFWMLPTDEVFGPWPQSGEIDIMEYQGKDPNVISGTAHYGNPLPDNKYKGMIYRLPSNGKYYDDFHTFVIEWDSTSITWYMDGTQYHKLTTKDLLPYNWPFTEKFHIILNQAMGGYLGGAIDDNSLPQTMLVDYVRVYTSPLNYRILGNQRLFTYATGETYYVPDVPDATSYSWSVPNGATITGGQGTTSITVDWGDVSSSGNITLEVMKPCGSVTLSLQVKLLDDSSCNIVLDDMDGNTNILYDSWTADNFFSSYVNPSLTGNSSLHVGYLEKTEAGTNQFTISQVPIGDYGVYETGERILYMDVYTNAPIGTSFEIQLKNKSKASAGGLNGIRSVLKAQTSLYRKWETLLFTFDRLEDASVTLEEIDELTVVFDPEEQLTYKYFVFDNVRRGILPYNAISGSNNPSLCDGTVFTYQATDNSSSSFVWSVPSGTTILSGQNTSTISMDWGSVTAGRIYLKENNSGCNVYTGTKDVKLETCATAIDDPESVALRLYPNPFDQSIFVEYPVTPGNVTLSVYSALGELVWRKDYQSSGDQFKEQLTLNRLKPGIYTLQVINGDRTYCTPMVKY